MDNLEQDLLSVIDKYTEDKDSLAYQFMREAIQKKIKKSIPVVKQKEAPKPKPNDTKKTMKKKLKQPEPEPSSSDEEEEEVLEPPKSNINHITPEELKTLARLIKMEHIDDVPIVKKKVRRQSNQQ
jgi:DNA modification methylase